MGDNRDLPKRGPSMAEQLAHGEKMLGGLETDLEERTRTPFARVQTAPASTISPQPKSEKDISVPSGEAHQEIERKIRSMVAQALSTTRGPSVICFIPKDRRRKYIAYPIVPEFESNEFGTVLVFQSTGTNVEVRGRNLDVLATAASFARLELVRIADGDFSTADAYVTDIMFHPPEPGRLTWSEKGEYIPAPTTNDQAPDDALQEA
jgi:hypothetical protein